MPPHGKIWRRKIKKLKSKFKFEDGVESRGEISQQHTRVDDLAKYHCHMCDVSVPIMFMPEHFNSQKHETSKELISETLERLGKCIIMAPDNITNIPDDIYYCTNCSEAVYKENEAVHNKSDKHIKSFIHDKLMNKLFNIYMNKNSIDYIKDCNDQILFFSNDQVLFFDTKVVGEEVSSEIIVNSNKIENISNDTNDAVVSYDGEISSHFANNIKKLNDNDKTSMHLCSSAPNKNNDSPIEFKNGNVNTDSINLTEKCNGNHYKKTLISNTKKMKKLKKNIDNNSNSMQLKSDNGIKMKVENSVVKETNESSTQTVFIEDKSISINFINDINIDLSTNKKDKRNHETVNNKTNNTNTMRLKYEDDIKMNVHNNNDTFNQNDQAASLTRNEDSVEEKSIISNTTNFQNDIDKNLNTEKKVKNDIKNMTNTENGNLIQLQPHENDIKMNVTNDNDKMISCVDLNTKAKSFSQSRNSIADQSAILNSQNDIGSTSKIDNEKSDVKIIATKEMQLKNDNDTRMNVDSHVYKIETVKENLELNTESEAIKINSIAVFTRNYELLLPFNNFHAIVEKYGTLFCNICKTVTGDDIRSHVNTTKHSSVIFKALYKNVYREIGDNFYHCIICNVLIRRQYDAHLTDKEHEKLLDTYKQYTPYATQIYCATCAKYIESHNYGSHVQGSKHIVLRSNAFQKKKEHPKYIVPGWKPNEKICDICKVVLKDKDRNGMKHIRTPKHEANMSAVTTDNNIKILAEDYYYCPTCNDDFDDLMQHLDKYHSNNKDGILKSTDKDRFDVGTALVLYFCEVCKSKVPMDRKVTHESGRKHKYKLFKLSEKQ